eukprot:GHVP01027580.1.p1 GENE.GHVP01027580.1~~GHVP01027580.1.p1  ORF type:complete len:175 (+),score=15.57 GHVP01027580.1:346-870(+)
MLVGGKYLEEYCRLMLIKYIRGCPPVIKKKGSLSTKFCVDVWTSKNNDGKKYFEKFYNWCTLTDSQLDVVKILFGQIFTRSATLAAICVAAVLARAAPTSTSMKHEVNIFYSGSLISGCSKYRRIFQERCRGLSGLSNLELRTHPDVEKIGAARLASPKIVLYESRRSSECTIR